MTTLPVTPLVLSEKPESLIAPASLKRVFDPFKKELQVTWFQWLDRVIQSNAPVEEKEKALLSIFSSEVAKEIAGRVRASVPTVTPKYDPSKNLIDYLKLDKPIVFYDLETDGKGANVSRIVQISAIKFHPDGRIEGPITQDINPERPIPEEVSLIHGIKDEDVKDKATFKEVAGIWHNFFENSHLGGFNIKAFDNIILQSEFKRAGYSDFNYKDKANIDVMKIYHDKIPWVEGTKRQLKDGYKFFCGQDLTHAHEADADTLATVEILKALFETYSDLPREVNALSDSYKTAIHDFVDPDKKFRWSNNEMIFNFGKYEGIAVKDVAKTNKGYFAWMLKEDRDFPETVKRIAKLAEDDIFPTPDTLHALLESVDLSKKTASNGNGKPKPLSVAQVAPLPPSSP